MVVLIHPFTHGILPSLQYMKELAHSFQISFQSALSTTPVISICHFTQTKMLFIYLLLAVDSTFRFLGVSWAVVLFFLNFFSVLSTLLTHDK